MEREASLARTSQVDESSDRDEDFWLYNLPNISTNFEANLGESFERIRESSVLLAVKTAGDHRPES